MTVIQVLRKANFMPLRRFELEAPPEKIHALNGQYQGRTKARADAFADFFELTMMTMVVRGKSRSRSDDASHFFHTDSHQLRLIMSSKPNTQQENKIARVHGGQSNRRTKDRGERKTVFKSVLSNPLEVKWCVSFTDPITAKYPIAELLRPIVAQDVQNATLDRIIELLQGVAEYNLNRQKRTRETRAIKRAEKRAKKSGQINAQQQQQRQNAMEVDIPAPNASTSTEPAPAPEILQHVTIGINAVTKRLEEQCYLPPRQNIKKSPAETSSNCPAVATANSGAEGSDAAAVAGDDVAMGNPGSSTDANPAATRAPIRTVLVCRPDIDPPILIAHVPYLVAACNSKGNHPSSSSSKDENDSGATHDPGARIKLVSLPKGAELKLAKATGLRRVSVLALDVR